MASYRQFLDAVLVFLVLVPFYASGDHVDNYLGRKYTLSTSENFLEVLKALGVGLVLRTQARFWTPTDKLTKSRRRYTYNSRSSFRNINETFIPEVPFNYTTLDGRNVEVTFTIKGARLREVQVEDHGRTTVIDRIFSRNHLRTTIKVGRLVSTRIFKADEDQMNEERTHKKKPNHERKSDSPKFDDKSDEKKSDDEKSKEEQSDETKSDVVKSKQKKSNNQSSEGKASDDNKSTQTNSDDEKFDKTKSEDNTSTYNKPSEKKAENRKSNGMRRKHQKNVHQEYFTDNFRK